MRPLAALVAVLAAAGIIIKFVGKDTGVIQWILLVGLGLLAVAVAFGRDWAWWPRRGAPTPPPGV